MDVIQNNKILHGEQTRRSPSPGPGPTGTACRGGGATVYVTGMLTRDLLRWLTVRCVYNVLLERLRSVSFILGMPSVQQPGVESTDALA